MELLITLRKYDLYDSIKNLTDGIIVGKYFTSGYHLSLEEITDLSIKCKNDNLKFYVALDDLISEKDRSLLINYFDFISKLRVDGVYFHDLSVIEVAKRYGLFDKLIYDGKTILTNSLETSFYLNTGLDSVVISRELTLQEVTGILKNNPNRVDMQIFGHIRMSYSKRHFLRNYFKQIDREVSLDNSEVLSITEENRDYHMPITDDESGTKIYSDFIFETYKEFPVLKQYLRRGIIDTIFLEDGQIISALVDFKRITFENRDFMEQSLLNKRENLYSTGYLYMKTNKTKDE